MKKIFALLAFILWLLIGVAFIFGVPISQFFNFNLVNFLRANRGVLIIFIGAYVILFSLLILSFKEEAGIWASRYKKWLQKRIPVWGVTNLAEDKMQIYLSPEFNSKIMVIMAYINIFLGVIFIIMGLLMN